MNLTLKQESILSGSDLINERYNEAKGSNIDDAGSDFNLGSTPQPHDVYKKSALDRDEHGMPLLQYNHLMQDNSLQSAQ